jgi:RsiW-degrading membrane proteinase PrsW (M82 family)
MNYSLSIALGVLPSIIWLLYYLRRDRNPEPKFLVLKIFFYGMLAALPALFIEKGIFEEIKRFSLSPNFVTILNTFLGVALVEETLKYLVVRSKILKDPEFNESIDAMLYMIIAALGFAASENILVLLQVSSSLFSIQTILVLTLRFWGATFLHALCSAIVGFFLALSFLRYKQEKFRLLGLALLISISLHGLFNFFIIKGGLGVFIPISVLILLTLFVTLGLRRLKRLTI